MITSHNELNNLRDTVNAAFRNQRKRVIVCAGTGCLAMGSQKVIEEFKRLVAAHGLLVDIDMLLEGKDGINVLHSGCRGFCEQGVLVRIEPAEIVYTHVTVGDVAEIVATSLVGDEVVERLVYHTADANHRSCVTEGEIPFFQRQLRFTLAGCGRIDPDDIREYIARDGYQAIATILDSQTPADVIKTILDSGLRGRGGGGFSTGMKWKLAAAEQSDKKYVICNGDEGDPGAFMDRSVMEGDPHRVIEGMMICGFAIGSDEGYAYVRAEYPIAVARLRRAVAEAKAMGFLGKNILGSGFSFDVIIREGAGAFVCGEETALMASIEGKRGMPNPRPPYPAVRGLWGKPTNINNVETYASVAQIILRGAEWFRSLGTSTSAGTKTFALAGQVQNTGLVEIPMGLTLREVVFDIGGGVRNGRKFKAVQIGGPSGGCLGEEQLDTRLDYEELKRVGAMVGSGGLVVLDDQTCMVETARYFMRFVQTESCGKCVPCREGTKQMLAILEKIVAGNGTAEDLELLDELAKVIRDGSLCGLGKSAPNAFLTTYQYFRKEYEAHVFQKRCPAGVCKALKSYSIVADKCKGCTLCARNCPAGAISGERLKPHVIDPEKCIKCDACRQKCKFDAITLA